MYDVLYTFFRSELGKADGIIRAQSYDEDVRGFVNC